MIRQADQSMLPKLKHMWQTCFDETQKNTEFVFSNLLNPAQMLVNTDEDGHPAAMLNWKLLRFTTPRFALLGAYIFGVATLPEYRGRGISRSLMSEVHKTLRRQDVSLACLVPAQSSLFGFYREQGFETEFSYRRVRVEAQEIQQTFGEGVLSALEADRMEDLRGRFFAGSRLFGDWDAQYLLYTCAECRFYGGEALLFSLRGSEGYAVCYPQKDGSVLVKEACVPHEDLPALLAALHARFGAESYELRLPVDFTGSPGCIVNEILPFAMVKWYDSEKRQSSGAPGGAPWFAFGLD